jgi:hypothetical protein
VVQQHAASFIAHTEASTGAELPRFIQAEPGAKQSSGLFVPGEGHGHWPGAACKAGPAATGDEAADQDWMGAKQSAEQCRLVTAWQIGRQVRALRAYLGTRVRTSDGI